MLRPLRNSMRFYSLQLLAYELLVLAVNLVAAIVTYPFKRSYSGFDVLMVWMWVYHWNKPIVSWGFAGYWVGLIVVSLILEAIADKIWEG